MTDSTIPISALSDRDKTLKAIGERVGVKINADRLRVSLGKLPPSRERSLALTKLDELEFWAKQALEKGDE